MILAMKKMASAIVVASMCSSMLAVDNCSLFDLNSVSAFALETDGSSIQNGLGVPPAEELNMDEYLERFGDPAQQVSQYVASNVTLAESCDLSMQDSFPKIGDQGGLGACTSWATAYYQFTYEAYKGTGINMKANENSEYAYSPAWTYNFTNAGADGGAFIYKTFDVLKEHGALKLKDYPYNGDPESADYSWSNNTEAMIEALNLRIVDYDVVNIPVDGASDNLNLVKQLIYGTDGTDGHVLTFSTEVYGWEFKKGINPDTNTEEWVAYRCNNGGGGHTMTIVGYNDNVWCDINGNGQKDAGEFGAFKVANSWGDWRNSGYTWVSYDALNATSAVSGNWEASKTTTRKPIFSYEFGKYNSLYWMEVGHKEVYYVGQLTVDTDYRNSLTVDAGRNDSESDILSNSKTKFAKYWTSSKDMEKVSHTGTLVFDYDDLADPIGDYISGYNWFVRLKGEHNTASFKITDNLSNTIVDFGNIDKGDSYRPISLSMGDLNYDGVVNNVDTEILYNARNNNTPLSNLQEYLATNMNAPQQDYTIDYVVTADWGTGQNIQVTIKNTGDVAIRNWALQCNDFQGTPSNAWNCVLLGDNIIKNATFNSDIAVGESVTFGYTLNNATGLTPVFTLCNFRTAKQNGYEVNFDVLSEWGSGFIGGITITNISDAPIMAWELNFTAVDFTITDTSQFVILENSGNTYKITGTYNGNIMIPPGTSVTLQFNGEKNGAPALSNVSLTEMVIEN